MATQTVHVPSIVAASMMFQLANTKLDVKGLLIGNLQEQEVTNVHDFEHDTITIEERFNVQKTLPSNKLFTADGELDNEEMRHILGNHTEENVIGWYRLRRNRKKVVTAREKSIQLSLTTNLSNKKLVFFLMTSDPESVGVATIEAKQSCFIFRRCFVEIMLQIDNMSESHEHLYWRLPVPWASIGGNETAAEHRAAFFYPDGTVRDVFDVNEMFGTMQKKIREISRSVLETDSRVEKLKKEILSIRRQLEEQPAPSDDTEEQPETPSSTTKQVRLFVKHTLEFTRKRSKVEPLPIATAAKASQNRSPSPPLDTDVLDKLDSLTLSMETAENTTAADCPLPPDTVGEIESDENDQCQALPKPEAGDSHE